MIKCEVIKKFNLKDFGKLKNIQRKSINEKGCLFVGDTFECDKEIADYLLGSNPLKEVVVKVIEVEPEIVLIPNAKPEEIEIIPISNAKIKDVKIVPLKTTKKKKASE